MTDATVIDILRSGIWTAFLVSGPALITALVVGVGISLVQALTQIQEQTLTFVPKIIAISVVLLLFLPLMFSALAHYTETLMAMIATPPQ